nr:ATP-binding protein [Shewanella sp. NIFS-20-20]
MFISLYLLLSLSILGIGWTLEEVWHSSFGQQQANQPSLLLLADLLEHMPAEQRQWYIKQIGQDPNHPLALLSHQQISLQTSQALKPNQVLSTINEQQQRYLFIPVAEHVLMLGPIAAAPLAGWESTFTLGFYLLLALVILLWIRPLSRDLRQLELAANDFAKAKWHTRVNLPTSSQVLSLGVAFNKMGKQIGNLIDNQQHLSNAVSHELRTPLARLKFALALLPSYCDNHKTPDQRSQFIADMQLDIAEMDDLLTELLSYARLESAEQNVDRQQCDLSSLIRQTIDKVQALCPTPIQAIGTDKPCWVMVEPSLIERALQNLLTNAIRYHQQQLRVVLVCHQYSWQIDIENDGPAINEQDQQRIFEPFYRSTSNHEHDHGFGLGLAIICRIMSRHQGDIKLCSNPSLTRFSLVAPREQHAPDTQ